MEGLRELGRGWATDKEATQLKQLMLPSSIQPILLTMEVIAPCQLHSLFCSWISALKIHRQVHQLNCAEPFQVPSVEAKIYAPKALTNRELQTQQNSPITGQDLVREFFWTRSYDVYSLYCTKVKFSFHEDTVFSLFYDQIQVSSWSFSSHYIAWKNNVCRETWGNNFNFDIMADISCPYFRYGPDIRHYYIALEMII